MDILGNTEVAIGKNEFQDCLDFSNEKEFINKIEKEYYPKKFPNLKIIERFNKQKFEDIEMQRNGIDIRLVLKNDKAIYIDEKRRKKNYSDILLEIGMDYQMNGIITLGWLLCERKKPDYIVYIKPPIVQNSLFEPTENIYKLPFEPLKNIFKEEFELLIKEYKEEFFNKNPDLKEVQIWANSKNIKTAVTSEVGMIKFWTLNKPILPNELFNLLIKEIKNHF